MESRLTFGSYCYAEPNRTLFEWWTCALGGFSALQSCIIFLLILYLLFCNKFNRPILHAAPFCSLYHLKKCKKIHPSRIYLHPQPTSYFRHSRCNPGPRQEERERKKEGKKQTWRHRQETHWRRANIQSETRGMETHINAVKWSNKKM